MAIPIVMRSLSAVLLLTILSLAPGTASAKQIRVGERPPEFFLANLEGKLKSLSQFRDRVVVLYFWADNCACAEKLPLLEPFYQKYKSKGLSILAINAGQPKKVVAAYMQNNLITYDMLLDFGMTAGKQYEVAVLPTIFIIDKSGVVREKILGEIDNDKLEKMILKILL